MSEHLIFENPIQDIMIKHEIYKTSGGVHFHLYHTVLENITALIDMVKMRPVRNYLSIIIQMNSTAIYKCADFNLVMLSQIFCQGMHGFAPGSQMSNTVARAQWLIGTTLGVEGTFVASPSVVEVIDRIFEGKLTCYTVCLNTVQVHSFFEGITDLFYFTNALQPPIIGKLGKLFWPFVVSMVAPRVRTSAELEFFLSSAKFLGQQSLRVAKGIYLLRLNRALSKPLMLLGETVEHPTDRPMIHLTSQLQIQSTFYAAHLNFMIPFVGGVVNTDPILYVFGTIMGSVAFIRNVSFTGGGIEFIGMHDVQIWNVVVREATTAIKVGLVKSLLVKSDLSRANIDKCVIAFATNKCELVRIMDQRISGVGMIFVMAECRTCELCNITARDCGSMGKITARSPVALNGCNIEAKLPNLATGLAGKILSVCWDKVLVNSSRGRIPTLHPLKDPLIEYTRLVNQVAPPDSPVETAPPAETAPPTAAPPAETVDVITTPIEPPCTPTQWFDTVDGWDPPALLFTPLTSPFASPTRVVSKTTPEKRARV